jgi:hypothetical protein
MGSSGTNSFSDYPGSSGGARGSGNDSGGGGTVGGEAPCEQQIGTRLEEVATCDYYIRNGALPGVGTAVSLRATLVSGRLGVQSDSGELIGFLPTSFNYLLQCIGRGFSFGGEVTESTQQPIPYVHVTLSGSL